MGILLKILALSAAAALGFLLIDLSHSVSVDIQHDAAGSTPRATVRTGQGQALDAAGPALLALAVGVAGYALADPKVRFRKSLASILVLVAFILWAVLLAQRGAAHAGDPSGEQGSAYSYEGWHLVHASDPDAQRMVAFLAHFVTASIMGLALLSLLRPDLLPPAFRSRIIERA